jgi:hypothetical protein
MPSPASPLLGFVPIPRTRLIGRDAGRAAAHVLLRNEAVALLTLSGPGGVGYHGCVASGPPGRHPYPQGGDPCPGL